MAKHLCMIRELLITGLIAISLASNSFAQTTIWGGSDTTNVSNWITSSDPFDDTVQSGHSLNWENVLVNTATINTVDNRFDVSFQASTNYTIGHLYIYSETFDLSQTIGGIDTLSMTANFEASAFTNWSPVVAITDGGISTFYRWNHSGNTWNGNDDLDFSLGQFDLSQQGNATNPATAIWGELNSTATSFGATRDNGTNPNLQATTGEFQVGFIQWGASTGGSVDPQIDFTTSIESFEVEIGWTPPAAGEVVLEIDRDSGNITFSNSTSGASVPTNVSNIIGYSVISDAGSLTQSGWNKFSTSSPLSNDNDNWTTLSTSSDTEDLSEAVLDTNGAGNGGDFLAGSIASPETIPFGSVWQRSPFEDVEVELLLDDGSILTASSDFTLRYVGNGDAPFDLGDLDTDGDVDVLDWVEFKSVYGSGDVSALTRVEGYFDGDINGDGFSNYSDFGAFRNAYDAANGSGAFSDMLAGQSVPEPSTLLIIVFSGVMAFLSRRSLKLACLACALFIAVFAMDQASAVTTIARFDAGSSGSTVAAPDAQGWTVIDTIVAANPSELGVSANVGALDPDGATGLNGWQINDNLTGGDRDNPRNLVGLTSNDYSLMFNYGWEFTYTARPVTANGNFISWATSGGGNIWGTSGDDRVGGPIRLGADNSWEIAPTGGSVVNLGQNSADSYHTVKFVGQPQSTTFSLFIDDVQYDSGTGLPGTTTFDLDSLGGNSSTRSNIQWQSGSSGGLDRVVNWNLVELAALTPQITARVNETSGEVSLINDGGIDFNIVGYSLTSDGNLLPGGFNSLESQGVGDGSMTADDGIGFEVLGTPSVDEVAEGALLNTVVSDNSFNFSLGNIWKTDGDKDLALVFTDEFGADIVGNVEYFVSTGLQGDFNGDDIVDLADYTVWRNNLGASDESGLAPGSGNGGGVDVTDYILWKSRFGDTAGAGSVAAAAVPEPSAIILVVMLLSVALLFRKVTTHRGISIRLTSTVASFFVIFLASQFATADVTLDRFHTFGDDGVEGASAGIIVGSNFVDTGTGLGLTTDQEVDETNFFKDAMDLSVQGNPLYVEVDGTDVNFPALPARPGAGAGTLGARFDGDGDTAATLRFNSPNEYWDSTDVQDWAVDPLGTPGVDTALPDYPRNYDGIFSRGISFWVYPDSADQGSGEQHDIVRDTAEHGVVITSSGTWGNAFDNLIRDSGVPVAYDQWSHVQVVSRSGARGSTLYIDGVAVEANLAVYDDSTAGFVVGSNLSQDGNFFTGVVDDMTVYLWGDNTGVDPGPAPTNAMGQPWGSFFLGDDNEVIATALATAGVTDRGDVDLDSNIDLDDVTAFLDAWQNSTRENLVGGIATGDWNSRQTNANGGISDLNYDGVLDLNDVFILHESLQNAGISISVSQILSGTAVPEPATWLTLLVAGVGLQVIRGRKNCKSR